jgi:hypothetical protein
MKKFLLTLLVIALAAPAMADGTVTLSAVANGADVDIVMTVDVAAAGDGPVGVALLVEADAGADLTDTVVVDSFFDIYMDLAFDEENGDGYLYGEGSNAVCKVGAAGQINVAGSAASVADAMADPARTYAVCAGGLGGESGTPADPPAQGSSVTLLTISGEAGASGTITLDEYRGGIVFKGGGTVTVNGLPLAISIEGGVCLGDGNGDGLVSGPDVPLLIATFGLVEGQAGYNPIFDFNGDNAVSGPDVPGFIAVFGTVCP